MSDYDELVKLRRLAELEGRTDVAAPEPSNWEQLKSFAQEATHKAKLAGSAALRGAGSMVMGALDAVGSQPDLGDAIRERQGLAPRTFTAPGEISQKLEQFGTQPKSKMDDYVNSMIQGATAALVGPGAFTGPAKALVTGAAGGLGGQAAGDIRGIKGTKYEAPARLAGALAGAVGVGTIASQQKNLPALARETLEDTRDSDLNKATKAMIQARMDGVDLNASQAMRVPSNIDNMVNTVTKMKEGQVLTDQLRGQARQTRQLARDMTDVLPGEVRGNQVVANSTQEAATQRLQDLRQMRTNATSPLFEASGDVPPDLLSAMLAKVQSAANAAPDTNKGELYSKLAKFLQNAQDRAAPQPTGFVDVHGQPIMGAPSPLPMNELNATMRSQLTNAKNVNMSTSAGDREAIGGLQKMIGDLRDDMGNVSPKFKQANDLYSQISREVVDPAKKGVVGNVMGLSGAQADKEAVNKITGILSAGRGPKVPASDSQILQFAAETKAQPEVFRNAVKTHFNNAIDAADKQVANGQAVTFPKALEKGLLGDATQRQGFKDMLNGIEQNTPIPMPKNSLYRGMLSGMKTLAAAGKRPGSIGPGSGALDTVAGQSKVAELGRYLNWNAFAHAGDKVSHWLSADAYRKMAEGLSTPEGLTKLRQLAEVPAMSPAAQVIVNSMLSAEASSNSPQVQNSIEGQEQPEERK